MEGRRPRRRAAYRDARSTSPSATTPRPPRARRSATTTRSSATTPTVVAERAEGRRGDARDLAAFAEAGADEVICFPASADPAQVDLLAEVVFA